MHLLLNDYRNPTNRHFIKCLVSCQKSQFIMYSGHVVRLFVHQLEHKVINQSQSSLILDLLLKSAKKERSCDDIFTMAAFNLQDLRCLITIMIGNLIFYRNEIGKISR
ncbi:hypothetical protein TSUD_252870 [Trifolium subterraneum]|nr:hypothetical protein TSUD_252870 [Trifolium subterraneum]